MSVLLQVGRMTQGIFVGHHDRTGAVLCIIKNGACARQKLDNTGH